MSDRLSDKSELLERMMHQLLILNEGEPSTARNRRLELQYARVFSRMSDDQISWVDDSGELCVRYDVIHNSRATRHEKKLAAFGVCKIMMRWMGGSDYRDRKARERARVAVQMIMNNGLFSHRIVLKRTSDDPGWEGVKERQRDEEIALAVLKRVTEKGMSLRPAYEDIVISGQFRKSNGQSYGDEYIRKAYYRHKARARRRSEVFERDVVLAGIEDHSGVTTSHYPKEGRTVGKSNR